MTLQTWSQIVIAIGLFLAAAGGLASHYFGKIEAEKKAQENIAAREGDQKRIVDLQEELREVKAITRSTKQEMHSDHSLMTSYLKQLLNKESEVKAYEEKLSKENQKDEVLNAVLAQYKSIHSAMENLYRWRGATDENEKAKLTDDILKTLSLVTIYPIEILSNHAQRPLFIRFAHNMFKVIFSGPMRIPPKITLYELPKGSKPLLLDNSKFGFTVKFEPDDIVVTSFHFTASAEL